MHDSLLIEWSRDLVNWAKPGAVEAKFPVVEIADPQVVEFPGYDNVLMPYAQLRDVVGDCRYTKWQAALAAVQGIYLIADTVTGKLYVGKADGSERIGGAGRPTRKTGMAGTSRCASLSDTTPTSPVGTCSAFCESSGRTPLNLRSTRQRNTSNGRCSPGTA